MLHHKVLWNIELDKPLFCMFVNGLSQFKGINLFKREGTFFIPLTKPMVRSTTPFEKLRKAKDVTH